MHWIIKMSSFIPVRWNPVPCRGTMPKTSCLFPFFLFFLAFFFFVCVGGSLCCCCALVCDLIMFRCCAVLSCLALSSPFFFLRSPVFKVYSNEGYERVKNTEGIRDVLLRHFPDIARQIPESQSGFKPWGVSWKDGKENGACLSRDGVQDRKKESEKPENER